MKKINILLFVFLNFINLIYTYYKFKFLIKKFRKKIFINYKSFNIKCLRKYKIGQQFKQMLLDEMLRLEMMTD